MTNETKMATPVRNISTMTKREIDAELNNAIGLMRNYDTHANFGNFAITIEFLEYAMRKADCSTEVEMFGLEPWQQDEMAPLPQAALFAHELLDHEEAPIQVFLGCDDRRVCARGYVEGQTSKEITEFYTAQQMKAQRTVITTAFMKLYKAQRDAMQEFVDRCNIGLVKSVYTYDKFKRILKGDIDGTSNG